MITTLRRTMSCLANSKPMPLLPPVIRIVLSAPSPAHMQSGPARRMNLHPLRFPSLPGANASSWSRKANRQRRQERWKQIWELFLSTGASDRDLARQLDIDHRTVKKFRIAEVYPEAKPRIRHSMVDDYAHYLDQRLSDGCRSSTKLWRELREQGFRGQVNAVRYWLRQRRNYRTRTALPPQRPTLRASPRQIVWFILKEAPAAKDMLEQVYRTSPEIGTLAQLAQSYFRMFKERNLEALPAWLEAAGRTALAGFVPGLERDIDAVREALKQPWNQGHVEGQVHRLKLIKRKMYGRAGFDLLRLRVLQQG